MSDLERRRFARIACPLKVQLTVAGRTQELLARDISKGGIFLFCSYVVSDVGTPVGVALRTEQGVEASLPGELVRIVEAPADHGGGILGTGIQWASLDEAQQRALDAILEEMLHGVGGQRRAHPRVSAHLRFACRTDQELKAVLLDLSRGGLQMEIDGRLGVGDPVAVSIDAPPAPLLSLKARVRRVDAPERGRSYRRVGLEFEPPSPDTDERLKELLEQLVHGD